MRNLEELNLQMLRNLQGVHAPFRLGMERALASKVSRHIVWQFYLINSLVLWNLILLVFQLQFDRLHAVCLAIGLLCAAMTPTKF